MGSSTANFNNARAMSQCIGDCNIGQLWQYGIPASAFLYSDTAFAALPNATTLFAGQILAPPAYWSGANGARYALDVVYQPGTTGVPNGGATTCKTTSTADQFVCTSAADLSAGQHITVGSNINKVVQYVDATNPNNVLVWTTSSLATVSSATALTFSGPVLGPEIQLPTKSAAVPTSLAWSEGDMLENSAAAANGVAAWVNVASGKPGIWAGIPLGNASGQIAPAQISTAPGTGNVEFQAGLSGKFMLGSGTMTMTPNAAAGTGPKMACAASHICDGASGTVTLTTGSGTTTGNLGTLSFPNAHANDANCVVTTTLNGLGLVTTVSWSESTTALTLTANTALTTGASYQVRYWCGGS
jgi:hypothetical protein